MNAAAGRLSQSILGVVVAVASVTGAVLAVVAPQFLVIDPTYQHRVLLNGVIVGVPAILLACAWTWVRMHRLRFTIRALGLGSKSVEAEDLIGLDRAASRVTLTTAIIATAASLVTLLPGMRPAGMDLDTAVSTVLLAVAFCATASLPLYVLIRRRVGLAMQLAPEDAMRETLERVRAANHDQRRLLRRMVTAVITPVVLVGFGTAILAHAHVRAFESRERITTATALAKSAFEHTPGAVPMAGIEDAIEAAREHGYDIEVSEEGASYELVRRGTGDIALTVPLDHGHASLRFEQTTVVALTTGGIIFAIFASVLAAALGALAGRTLVDDLTMATTQMQLLGTEAVLRGTTHVARPARFAIVAELGLAVDRLADRFRVFASAQESAIAAREEARRMRGLLFASVSHDLKSPLNAILGFADLIDPSTLTPSQAESLHVIQSRGRELLGLIQTILDAARVEAGQLVLHKSNARINDLVEQALQAASLMVHAPRAELVNNASDAAFVVHVDPGRVVDALAALVRHGLRTAAEGTVRVSAAIAPSGQQVLVDVETQGRSISASQLARLMLPDGGNTLPRTSGGLALGLSLARSLAVLNDGSVQPIDTAHGLILRLALPLAQTVERQPDCAVGLSATACSG